MKSGEAERYAEDVEQLVKTAFVMETISTPMSLQVLRRLDLRPESALTIAGAEWIPTEDVQIHLERFNEAGLVRQYSKQWWELTPLGKLAAEAVRQVSRRLGQGS